MLSGEGNETGHPTTVYSNTLKTLVTIHKVLLALQKCILSGATKFVSQYSAILGELESFRNYEEFRIIFLPENFRWNLTYYEGDNFSDSFFNHIFEPENFRIFFTRYEKKKDSPRCPFCPADHTIIHLFAECAQATLFWKEFLDWASRMVNSKLSLSTKEIMFGIINNDSKFCSAFNHLVIIGKYFLYVKALNGKFYILNEFVSLARDKISLKKYISCTTGREKEFRTKWSVFSSLLNTV